MRDLLIISFRKEGMMFEPNIPNEDAPIRWCLYGLGTRCDKLEESDNNIGNSFFLLL